MGKWKRGDVVVLVAEEDGHEEARTQRIQLSLAGQGGIDHLNPQSTNLTGTRL